MYKEFKQSQQIAEKLNQGKNISTKEGLIAMKYGMIKYNSRTKSQILRNREELEKQGVDVEKELTMIESGKMPGIVKELEQYQENEN